MKIRGIKTTAIKCITVLVLMAALLLASNPGAADPGAPPATKPASFLFVLQSQQGLLSPIAGHRGYFHLTLRYQDTNRVIAFSDRPYRIVRYLTAKQLQSAWGFGKNSFAADPPNAVLSADGYPAQIVVLQGMVLTPHSVSFVVHLTQPGPHALTAQRLINPSLVIDLATGWLAAIVGTGSATVTGLVGKLLHKRFLSNQAVKLTRIAEDAESLTRANIARLSGPVDSSLSAGAQTLAANEAKMFKYGFGTRTARLTAATDAANLEASVARAGAGVLSTAVEGVEGAVGAAKVAPRILKKFTGEVGDNAAKMSREAMAAAREGKIWKPMLVTKETEPFQDGMGRWMHSGRNFAGEGAVERGEIAEKAAQALTAGANAPVTVERGLLGAFEGAASAAEGVSVLL